MCYLRILQLNYFELFRKVRKLMLQQGILECPKGKEVES